jgi:hypothetical protein
MEKQVTLTLSLPEAKLLAYLLQIAADEFSNHGCNDLSLKDAGLLPSEFRTISESWARNLPNEPPPHEGEYQFDWCMMLLFKAIVEKSANIKAPERR